MSPASGTPCPRCGATASGPFCASCGAPVGSRACGNCGASLAAGAKFCHKCGTAPGQAGKAGARGIQTPWIVAGILTLVTVAAIAYSARDKAAPAGSQMANAGNAAGSPATSDGTGPATIDISKMPLSEQYIKLMNKVTAAAENGDSATVINFTPMALGAYANLPAADRDIDARYHAAMLQTNVGMFAAALALADTISKEAPNNLMATYVRIIVAQYQGDSTKAKAERAKFREHFDAEMLKKRSEYEAHTEFLQNYRKGAAAK